MGTRTPRKIKTILLIITALALAAVVCYGGSRLATAYSVRQPVLEAVVDWQEAMQQHPELAASASTDRFTGHTSYFSCPDKIKDAFQLGGIRPRLFWHGDTCGFFAIKGYRVREITPDAFHSVYCTFRLEQADPAKLYIYSCDRDYIPSMIQWPVEVGSPK